MVYPGEGLPERIWKEIITDKKVCRYSAPAVSENIGRPARGYTPEEDLAEQDKDSLKENRYWLAGMI